MQGQELTDCAVCLHPTAFQSDLPRLRMIDPFAFFLADQLEQDVDGIKRTQVCLMLSVHRGKWIVGSGLSKKNDRQT